MGMLEEIGNFLQGQGIGIQGTDIFLGDVPQNAPDAAVAIIETSGLAPIYIHGINGPGWNQPSFQIFTRALTYATARSKAEDIFKALAVLTNVADCMRKISLRLGAARRGFFEYSRPEEILRDPFQSRAANSRQGSCRRY